MATKVVAFVNNGDVLDIVGIDEVLDGRSRFEDSGFKVVIDAEAVIVTVVDDRFEDDGSGGC